MAEQGLIEFAELFCNSTPEMTKGSSGKPKSGAPAHANRTAYRHNPSSKLTKRILAMPICGLCPACHEQIEWRKRFRKYKPLTVPKKCVECGQKTIKDAYHVICRSCAAKGSKCEKCLESRKLDEKKAEVRAVKEGRSVEEVTAAVLADEPEQEDAEGSSHGDDQSDFSEEGEDESFEDEELEDEDYLASEEDLNEEDDFEEDEDSSELD